VSGLLAFSVLSERATSGWIMYSASRPITNKKLFLTRFVLPCLVQSCLRSSLTLKTLSACKRRASRIPTVCSCDRSRTFRPVGHQKDHFCTLSRLTTTPPAVALSASFQETSRATAPLASATETMFLRPGHERIASTPS
jgi:hypothetical protein